MTKKLHILFLSFLLTLFFFPQNLFAKTFKAVASPDAKGILYVKKGSNGDGSSWNNALGELSAAVGINDPAILQIWVASGSYTPFYGSSFLLTRDIKIYGGFYGNENDLNQRDLKTNVSILKGLNNSVIKTERLTSASVIDGFTIIDGFAVPDRNSNGGSGGGINTLSSDLTISNCIFTNNNATVFGGGIYNFSGHPKIINCTFTKNKKGAIYNSSSSPTITNCSFEKNVSLSSTLSNEDSIAIISNCNFIENSGQDGGAVYNENSTVTFTNCNFIKNISTSGSSGNNGGAGMYNVLQCTINIYNCSFIENSAYRFGGAIVSNNYTKVNIANSLFANNKARTQGSELYNSAHITLDITNTTFFNNTVDAIILESGSLKFSNCIVWADFKNDMFYGLYTSKNSIILSKTDTFNGNIDATGISDTQIFKNPSAGDYSLLEGGIAINKGNNALYDPLIFGNLDLSGKSRINETTIDLGAYESKNVTLSVRDIEKTNLRTYPNPVKGDFFNIENASLDGNAILYDISGKEVKSVKIENGKAQVNISNLPGGIYLLKTAKGEALKIIVE